MRFRRVRAAPLKYGRFCPFLNFNRGIPRSVRAAPLKSRWRWMLLAMGRSIFPARARGPVEVGFAFYNSLRRIISARVRAALLKLSEIRPLKIKCAPTRFPARVRAAPLKWPSRWSVNNLDAVIFARVRGPVEVDDAL